jgi:hypothetical protein
MYDLNDNPISSGQITCTGNDFTVLSVKADCRSGYVLRAEAADLNVEARRAGAADWTDLIADALPLDPWNGSRETFEVRVSGEIVAARQLTEARIIVEPV